RQRLRSTVVRQDAGVSVHAEDVRTKARAEGLLQFYAALIALVERHTKFGVGGLVTREFVALIRHGLQVLREVGVKAGCEVVLGRHWADVVDRKALGPTRPRADGPRLRDVLPHILKTRCISRIEVSAIQTNARCPLRVTVDD